MRLTVQEILKRPLLTEKSTFAKEEANQAVFEVDKRANKIQIRKAVEELFDVRVLAVNTSIVRGKVRRLGRNMGKRSDWKKAVVTLMEGDTIEFLERV